MRLELRTENVIKGSKLVCYALITFFLSVPAIGQSREFLFNNGINYMLADKEKAIKQFTRAIEIDSNFSAAYFYRGIAEFKLGRYNNARKKKLH